MENEYIEGNCLKRGGGVEFGGFTMSYGLLHVFLREL